MVSEHLKLTCQYLGYKGIRRLLQHSSVVTTQRYIGVGDKEIEDVLLKTVKICYNEIDIF